jgi:uncharacterized protein
MARLATILLIVGGLNWGLIGFFQYDLIAAIFGGQAAVISRIIYALVGLSAVYEIFVFPRFFRPALAPKSYDRIDRAA